MKKLWFYRAGSAGVAIATTAFLVQGGSLATLACIFLPNGFRIG